MRASVTSSAIIHAVLLGWGLLTFSSPTPMDLANSESLPIEIVSDTSQMVQGDKKAPKSEKPAPKPTEKPQTKPDAVNIGDAETDVESKPIPATKPKIVEAAEAPKQSEIPVTKPDPKPEIQPETKPVPTPATEIAPEAKPKQEVKPDPIMTAINNDSKPAPTPDAPKVEPTPQAEKPAEEAFKLPQNVAKPEDKPKPAPAQTATTPERKESKETPKPTKTAPTPSKEKNGIAEEAQALLNREKASGGGQKRSTDQTSLGAKTTTGAGKLSQSEMDALRGQISKFYNPPVGIEDIANPIVTIVMKLNQSGMIVGDPVIEASAGGSGVGRVLTEAARRAILRAQPFNLPADKYDGSDGWNEVRMNFDPRDL
ncbi:cell envelope integrity protein TolA [Phyllobacterium sp. 628]|uniref:cell envelope integrity protein TolA n=1 Tax=Phyllobacterium sp. 628 TaxID=2718938 RepID=UPI0016623547|nr:cell envelope integrity protein TolA [Phyllobacterium sp. 628]QND50867.1 cell envelope integrity protein TolA [Phyllobacterium sp. 628]